MNKEEAEQFAKEMSYRQAVCYALQGKSIPYRKATMIKLHELLEVADMFQGYEDYCGRISRTQHEVDKE